VLEHHSHLLPWKKIALERGAKVIEVPIDEYGRVSLPEIKQWLDTGRVRIIGCTLVSNVLGTRQPIEQIVEMSHSTNAKVVVDAAQAVAHMPIDVVKLGVDALVFGGHKVYGPAGVGVLWAKSEWMRSWEPWMLGGGMVSNVEKDAVTWMDGPHRFEAGTTNVSSIVGLVAALDWLDGIGWAAIQEAEMHLIEHLQQGFNCLQGTSLLCENPDIPLFSFVMDGVHPHDVGTMCDLSGVMIRTGQHCAQPLHRRLDVDASSRVSLSFLNTPSECARFFEVLQHVEHALGGSG
jgi:cysteine desulfurase/selenocysteine lyase